MFTRNVAALYLSVSFDLSSTASTGTPRLWASTRALAMDADVKLYACTRICCVAAFTSRTTASVAPPFGEKYTATRVRGACERLSMSRAFLWRMGMSDAWFVVRASILRRPGHAGGLRPRLLRNDEVMEEVRDRRRKVIVSPVRRMRNGIPRRKQIAHVELQIGTHRLGI